MSNQYFRVNFSYIADTDFLFSIVHYIMIISIFQLNTALFLQDLKSCFPLLTFYINDLLLQSLSKNHQRFSHQKLLFQTLTKIQFWLISFSINSSFYLLLHTFNTSSFFLTMSHSLFSNSELSSYDLTVFQWFLLPCISFFNTFPLVSILFWIHPHLKSVHYKYSVLKAGSAVVRKIFPLENLDFWSLKKYSPYNLLNCWTCIVSKQTVI